MVRCHFSAREFIKLENWCATGGGWRDRRTAWKTQLDERRGHLSPRERGGATKPEDRWLEIQEGDKAPIIEACKAPKGGTNHHIREIFSNQDFVVAATVAA